MEKVLLPRGLVYFNSFFLRVLFAETFANSLEPDQLGRA